MQTQLKKENLLNYFGNYLKKYKNIALVINFIF